MAFAVGYGGILPQDSLKEIKEALIFLETILSITGEKSQKSIFAAITALGKNEFNSYLFTPQKNSVLENALTTKFMDEMHSNFKTDMCINEQHCQRNSPNF